jgi:phosphatidylserine decarboxylase
MDSTMATMHIPRRAGWLPHPDVMNDWYQHQIKNLHKYKDRPWNDVITKFKNLIESNPEIYMGFEMMFEETKQTENPTGGAQVCYSFFSYPVIQ